MFAMYMVPLQNSDIATLLQVIKQSQVILAIKGGVTQLYKTQGLE